MSKLSLFLAVPVCGAILSMAPRADAFDPGANVDGLSHALHIGESNDEGNTIDISGSVPNGVCDGYVVMGKEAQAAVTVNGAAYNTTSPSSAPSGWSDVVVFHDGVNLPSGVCGSAVKFMTIISRPDIGWNTIVSSNPPADFPATGCLMKNNFHVTPPPPSPNWPPNPLVSPNGDCTGSLIEPDYTRVAPFLQGLTVEQVIAGAGANATVYKQETLIAARNDGIVYTPGSLGDAGATTQYTIFSDVPALPPWGMALLGATLVGGAVVLMRRNRHGVTLVG
jgi:hypothetical protein